MGRLTDNDHNWGPFTVARWRKNFCIEWNSGGGYWGPGNFFLVCGFGWALKIRLPSILKPYGERYDDHPRVYGMALSDMGAGYDFFQLYFGPQTHDSLTTKNWSKHLPWMMWDMVRHSFYGPDGALFYTEPHWLKRRKLAKKNGGIDKHGWDETYKKMQEVPRVHFGFEDYDGEMIIASCYIEEREWHRGTGWFRWLKYFWPAKIRRDLSLEFDKEVGPEKGSWKGGTTGHGVDMLPGETVEQSFRRYCEKEHRARADRHFKIRYIGPSKPPEPKDIRVARARGWKQCDYPHESAKDMWHHDDALPCQDGKFISTEEMLEYIKAETDAHNAQVSGMIKAA